VILDGEPLPSGNILFVPTDRSKGPEPSEIKEGEYELWAYEGQKRVEISAAKIIPGSKTCGAGGEPVPEEYLPERYNFMSELEATVAANDNNRIDFTLSLKKN